MCAIFGVVSKEYQEKELKKAFDTLLHRGEDFSNTLKVNELFLGVHRLAITNITTKTLQPFKFKDTITLFNGEIYNFEELKEKYLINTSSEVELLSRLFDKFGLNFVKYLDGMFAISIITPKKIYLFRDNFGKKPLFYSKEGENFIFSSEIRAILALQKEKKFQRKALSHLLFFQSFIAPKTLFRNIFQVCPGEVVIFDRFTKELQRNFWFKLDSFSKKNSISFQKAVLKIDELLTKAISKRVPKEVEFGALLSGGLDSSLVCALLAKDRKIDTFSIGYENFKNYDEREFAKSVAKHINSNHTEVIFSKRDFFESLEEWVKHLDEPLLDPAAIPLWHLMKKIKEKEKKVIFTGDGSDEIFLGYRLYSEYLDIQKAEILRHKSWFKNYFRANFSMNKEWERYKRVFEEKLLFRSMAELFTDLQLNLLLKLNVADNSSLEEISHIHDRFLEIGGVEDLDWYSFVDLHTILAELFLKKLDRVSMAFSIEARSPFLDKELVEFVLSLNPNFRLSSPPKALLKEVAKNYLPQKIIQRKKKGFSYPFIEWLKEENELKIIDEVQEKLRIFRQEQLDLLLAKSRNSKRFKHHIFAIYLLSKWLKVNYLD